jgi:predicted nucleic-acid-binding protein
MIGVDTNVIVRLLVGDDAAQQRSAHDFLTRHTSPDEPARIDRIAAVETVWVLERRYGYSRTQIASAIEKLLDTAEIAFEDHDLVRSAVRDYRQGIGFADALMARGNEHAGCTTTLTFDAVAAKRLASFTLLSGITLRRTKE